MIIFGTYFGGKVKEVDNQWIETKYFLLMIPLIPINTMFVTHSEFNKRNGFEIDVNGKSVLHGYIRFITFIAALGLLLVGGFAGVAYDTFPFLGIPLPVYAYGLLLALIWSYSYFEHKKSVGAELIDRKKIGAILGVNALPEWLPQNVRSLMLTKINAQVQENFPGKTLREMVNTPSLRNDQVALLYAYLRFLQADSHGTAPDIDGYLKTINNKYNQLVMMGGGGKSFNDIHKEMKDDLTDDVSKKYE